MPPSSGSFLFSRYRFTPDGLARWPSHRVTHRWDQLNAITTVFQPTQRIHRSTWHFAGSKSVTLRGQRVFTFGQGPGRLARSLALAIRFARPETEIDAFSHFLATHGLPPRQSPPPPHQALAPDDWLHLARQRFAWTEVSPAFRAVERALTLDPHHAAAHAFKHHLAVTCRIPPGEIRAAALLWATHCPDDEAARLAYYQIQIQLGDKPVRDYAIHTLQSSEFSEPLAIALADSCWQKRQWLKSAEIWDRIADHRVIPSQIDAARDHAARQRHFALHLKVRVWQRTQRFAPLTALLLPLLIPVMFTLGSRDEAPSPPTSPTPPPHEDTLALPRPSAEPTGESPAWSKDTPYSELKPQADIGDADAQFAVSAQLLEGTSGAPQDRVMAMRYLQLAAKQDHVDAMIELARRLYYGEDLTGNRTQAFEWLDRAIAAGSGRAARIAGEYCREGLMEARDPARALAYFQKAEERGDALGTSLLGWMLEQGETQSPDPDQALIHYRKAAAMNDTWAMERLVFLLNQRTRTVPEREEAWQWTERGAQRGAERLVAVYLFGALSGQKTDPDAEAAALKHLFAFEPPSLKETDLLRAQIAWEGWQRPRDFAAALQWYERAHEKGVTGAMSRMIACHAYGLGTPQDLNRAKDLRATVDESAYRPDQLRDMDEILKGAQIPGPPPDADSSRTFEPLWQKQPIYPFSLRRAGITGQATIRFQVDARGFVRTLEILDATHPRFGAAAADAVLFWRIAAPINPDTGLSASTAVPIIFNIVDDPAETPAAPDA